MGDENNNSKISSQSVAKGGDTPLTLGTKSISQLLVQYSVPAIIASVAVSLYNIIDSIFIGQGVGPMAIAGLAITFPLMNLVVAFCTLIAVGGATISSIFIGQKNESRATDCVNNVMVLCLIHSVLFGGVTLLFLDPILLFFGATPETIDYAREFMRIILYGTPVSYVFIGLNNLMRATGYPKKAMVSALLSVAVNAVLAPTFIFVFDWGISGAAWATVCGRDSLVHMGAVPLHVEEKFHPFPSRQPVVQPLDHTPHLLDRAVALSDERMRLHSGGVYQPRPPRLRRRQLQPRRRRLRYHQPHHDVFRDDSVRCDPGYAAHTRLQLRRPQVGPCEAHIIYRYMDWCRHYIRGLRRV